MHELGIAQNILQIVRQSVPEEQTAEVRKIRMRLGKLSGVIAESLDFCFNVIISDTEMGQASLEIEHVPVTAECRECGHRFAMDDLDFSCTACKSTQLELLSGKELELVEIELSDQAD